MIYIVIKYDKIIMKMSKHQTVQIQTTPSDFKSKTISFYPYYPYFTPNFSHFTLNFPGLTLIGIPSSPYLTLIFPSFTPI